MLSKGLKKLTHIGASFAVLMATATAVNAQCDSWEAYPKGVEEARTQHASYRTSFRAENYAEAFPIWQDLFATVQSPKDAPARHFQNGITMYNEFAKVEKDAAKKKEYIDAMNKLYDDMAACLGEKSVDRSYQAYYLYALGGNPTEVIAAYEKAMELGKMETPNMVLTPIARLTTYVYGFNLAQPEEKRSKKFTAEYMRNLYEQLKGIAEHNIANNKAEGQAAAYTQSWTEVQAEFDKVGGSIWGCDFFVDKLKPDFEAAPNNMEQNAEMLATLKEKCGEENELYVAINAIYAPYAQHIKDSTAEANFDALCNLDKGSFRLSQSQKAKKAGDKEEADRLEDEAYDWFEKSLDDPITEDCKTTTDDKGKLAYSLADRYYRSGSFSKARSLCYKAAELKKGWGKPYMLIGTLYASSGKRCSGGKGTGWDAQVVIWPAMDMWQKAKSVDSRVAGEANSQIAKYKKYLPTKGDIFQRGLKVGASYQVGCWIGASTTIRAGGQQ